MQAELDVRTCCLSEIKQTEEKYTETLESIEKVLKCLEMKTHNLYRRPCFLVLIKRNVLAPMRPAKKKCAKNT